jgi:hypothetical protein
MRALPSLLSCLCAAAGGALHAVDGGLAVERPHHAGLPGGGSRPGVRLQEPPADGSMRVRRLRLVVGVFAKVAETLGEARAMPPVDAGEPARIERELRDAAAWYFHHSGHRLWLDLRFVHDREPRSAGSLSASGEPDGAPPIDLLEDLARRADLPVAEVSGFVVVMDFRRRADETAPFERVGRGGGLTLGAHGRGHGLSWWFVPGTPGYDGWLFCHEFHHQLDALFDIAGHPEYPFNHFAPAERNVAFFGEHWDGNRWILAGWPDHLWDALRSGDAVVVVDRDRDGLPDRDPRLPFDEERFGSRPDRADTDGDGLDDGAEARLGRWLRQSGFEAQLGPEIAPDPRQPDTDGDGLRDGDDPEPLLGFRARLEPGTWVPLRRVDDPQLRVETELRVVDGRLEVRTRSPDAQRLQIQVLLDREADGWFAGPVNARVQARGTGARVVEVLDASSPVEWPQPNGERRSAMRAAVVRDADLVTLTIDMERPIAPLGDAFAVGIAYRGGLGRPGDPRWWSLFEPHRLIRFETAGPPRRDR